MKTRGEQDYQPTKQERYAYVVLAKEYPDLADYGFPEQTIELGRFTEEQIADVLLAELTRKRNV